MSGLRIRLVLFTTCLSTAYLAGDVLAAEFAEFDRIQTTADEMSNEKVIKIDGFFGEGNYLLQLEFTCNVTAKTIALQVSAFDVGTNDGVRYLWGQNPSLPDTLDVPYSTVIRIKFDDDPPLEVKIELGDYANSIDVFGQFYSKLTLYDLEDDEKVFDALNRSAKLPDNLIKTLAGVSVLRVEISLETGKVVIRMASAGELGKFFDQCSSSIGASG